MADTTPIPEGFMTDSAGRLVPIATIRPIDIERDKLVREIVAKALDLSNALAKFKGAAFGDIEAFVELSAEQYGVKVRGYMSQLGPIPIPFVSWDEVPNNPFYAPNADIVPELEAYSPRPA